MLNGDKQTVKHGPLPRTVAHGALTLRTPKGHEWKWEKSFLADCSVGYEP